MKQLFFISLLLTQFGIMRAQEEMKEIEIGDTTKVVINLKMIERFNSVDYPENAVTMNSLLSTYNFEELKLIMHAYHKDELLLQDEEVLNEKLAELKKYLNDNETERSSIHNYLTETISP